MGEIIGELVAPREFILPEPPIDAQPTMSGAMFLSGTKVYFVMGGAPVLMTSG